MAHGAQHVCPHLLGCLVGIDAGKAGGVRITALGITGRHLLKKGLPGYFPPDYPQAAKLFASSMGMGYSEAQANLGVMYVNGLGVPKDPQKAFSLWKDGAENHSDPTCMFYYAYALEGGLTGEKKPAEARDWYKRAAKAGNGSAVDWCRRNNVSFSE